MSTLTTRTLPVRIVVALALLIGSIAPRPNVAAAELPQHVPLQGFGPADADFAPFSGEAQFGHAVAIRNGFAFIGMPLAQDSIGRVAVFVQNATGWQRTATLVPPTRDSDRNFGRTVTFRDGVVVIGSNTAAYVFRRSNDKFIFVQKLVALAADGAVEFPMALRYESGTLFASAYRGGTLPSVVYIFELDSTRKFVGRGKLTGPANELFGADLSMTATTLVVGSPGGRSRLRQSGLFHHGPGSAYVFQRDSSGRWRQTQRLMAGPAGGFGSAVAIDRGMIVVGAPQEDIEGGPRGEPVLDDHIAGGAAHVFVPVAGRYVETLRLRPRPDERIQYMDFGHRIAMFDGNIVIGAVQPYGAAEVAPGGFTFTYRREGSSVTPRGIAAGHPVAYSIGLFHNLVLIGAAASRGSRSGSARIYDVNRVTRTTLPLTYRMTRVVALEDAPPFTWVDATGLNDKGEVIGTYVSPGEPPRAFLWREGTLETLIPPAGHSLAPVAINDRSLIAGNCRTAFEHICLRPNGQFSILEVPDELGSVVLDLSNNGHVLGAAPVFGEEDATYFVWHGGKFTFLEPAPGFSAIVPVRMNDSGTIIAGRASNATATPPVIWRDGTMMTIGLPPGVMHAFAKDVNDRGMVLLDAHTWQAGQFTRLEPPDGLHTSFFTLKLNNRGVVAGYSGGAHATLWLEGHGWDLSQLVAFTDPAGPFIHLFQAHFLNDRNQVIVQVLDSRSADRIFYLLTPVGLHD
jgi:uncharacterized membrane protein